MMMTMMKEKMMMMMMKKVNDALKLIFSIWNHMWYGEFNLRNCSTTHFNVNICTNTHNIATCVAHIASEKATLYLCMLCMLVTFIVILNSNMLHLNHYYYYSHYMHEWKSFLMKIRRNASSSSLSLLMFQCSPESFFFSSALSLNLFTLSTLF